jgi:membrane fusion protein (multidrug efflux system)
MPPAYSDKFEHSRQPQDERNERSQPPADRDDQHADEENQDKDGSQAGGEKKDEKAQEQKPPPWHRPTFWIVAAIIVVVGFAVGIPLWLYARSHESTDDAFIDANTVTVSPQVAGHIIRRLVADNEEVQAGQLLIQIDPRDFQDTLAEADAAEKVAEDQLAQYQAMVTVTAAQEASSRADVVSAQANADQAHSDAQRYRSAETGAVSQQQLDNATNNEKSTAAALQAAKAKLAAAAAQLYSAKVQVRTAEAQVHEQQTRVADAKLQLSYTDVTAPAAGRVTNRHVEVGSYVQIGEALVALVPHEVWVTANFKETQLQYMKRGQKVKIHVDSYSDKTFWGHVDSIAAGSGAAFSLLPPENATGNYVKVVQRVPVKILFDQTPEELMAPGMSVDPVVNLK